MNPIKVLIVDDHTLVRESWAYFLNLNPHFQVVGEAGNGEKAIELSTQLQPDVVIMDINLPGMNGIDAGEKIKKLSPLTKVLGVSMHNQPEYAKMMIRKGGMGYITKNSPQEEMFHAILEVASGRKYICQEIKDHLSEQVITNDNNSNNIRHLTAREKEVIQYLKQGKSSKEVACLMHLSIKTIEVHRYNILKKLNLKNTAALINYINGHRTLLSMSIL